MSEPARRPLPAKQLLQKQHERFLLGSFLEAAGFEAAILDDSCESPDFIIQCDGRRIGVEVSEVFQSHAASGRLVQAQEAIQDRIVRKAQQLYLAAHGVPAHVTVTFDAGFNFRHTRRDAIAAGLARFVHGQHLSAWGRAEWRQDYASRELSEAVVYLNMMGVPSHNMGHWTASRAGWVAPMTDGILQSRVDEKSLLLERYSSRVAINWLVLVADGTRPSQFFNAPSRADAALINSPFARTFYFGRFNRDVVELGLKPAALTVPRKPAGL